MSTDPAVAFYTARLDEDERTARRIQATRHGTLIVAPGDGESPPVFEISGGRLLAEVEAKRKLLARHTPEPMNGYDSDVDDPSTYAPGCPACQTGVVQPGDWPCEEMRDLLSVHNTHPHYRDEWRP
ncbi:hypothetical protein GCM10017673_38900 [Streptosporangium violaceochromogenes]|nr:hypothetical protein GCM10017673_38900 [Streptosporangium violaceochromogenes]